MPVLQTVTARRQYDYRAYRPTDGPVVGPLDCVGLFAAVQSV